MGCRDPMELDLAAICHMACQVSVRGHAVSHIYGCPRYGLLCECSDCAPPICLCKLIQACTSGTPEDVRIAFYAAVEAL